MDGDCGVNSLVSAVLALQSDELLGGRRRGRGLSAGHLGEVPRGAPKPPQEAMKRPPGSGGGGGCGGHIRRRSRRSSSSSSLTVREEGPLVQYEPNPQKPIFFSSALPTHRLTTQLSSPILRDVPVFPPRGRERQSERQRERERQGLSASVRLRLGSGSLLVAPMQATVDGASRRTR